MINPRKPNPLFCRSKVTMCVSVVQSYLTLCHPVDYSQPGSSVHGISQEWDAISFSRGSFQPRDSTQADCRQAEFCSIWAKVALVILLIYNVFIFNINVKKKSSILWAIYRNNKRALEKTWHILRNLLRYHEKNIAKK